MPAPLTIRLFGSFQVLVHGEPIPRVRSRSVEWLLSLLTLRSGQRVNRVWLAGTLWPDSEESQALQNLRNALLSLRQALGPEAGRIESPTRDTLSLNLDGADVDVKTFDEAIRNGREAALREAVTAQSGPLLEGCFEEWVTLERENRQQACLHSLESLAHIAEERGDYEEALVFLRRAEGMDALRDSTQRALMRALSRSGDTPAALFAYRDYRARLRREMNVDPDADTVALYKDIRARSGAQALGRSNVQGAGSSAGLAFGHSRVHDAPGVQSPAHTGYVSSTHTIPAPKLPHPLTTLIGREDAVREVVQLIANSRLVTLVGGGGVGKTRLSIRAAAELESQFPDGVAFVALASLADPALLPTYVASTLGIREEATADTEFVQHALSGWLTARSFLLVLDNCEHVVADAARLAQSLLECCPRLRILATSRQRLGVIGEAAWRVPSLESPSEDLLTNAERSSADIVQEFPAVRLFLDRAAMARPGFRIRNDDEALIVSEICRQLDGIPLALELAAARLEVLTIGQIAARLKDRFSLLTGAGHGTLPRHQTLRALIDWSYELLSEEESALLRRLSVFSGGWTLEAAEAVFGLRYSVFGNVRLDSGNEMIHAEDSRPDTKHRIPKSELTTLDLLGSLVDKSLVQAEDGDCGLRYRMLEMVREYATNKLREQTEEEDARGRHARYYLDLASDHPLDFGGAEAEEQIPLLEAEISNFRAALRWARTADPECGLEICAALWPYWEMCGYLTEGRGHLASALSDPATQNSRHRSRALLGAARLAIFQHHLGEAVTYGLECLERFRSDSDHGGMAAALICLGEAELADGAYNRARESLKAGRRESLISDWRQGTALATLHLGKVALFQNDLDGARILLEEGLALAEALGERRMLAMASHNLGMLGMEESDEALARTMLARSLALNQDLGDKLGTARAIGCLAVLEKGSNVDRAIEYCRQEASIFRELGNPAGVANAVHSLGTIYYELGEYVEARQAYEEAMSLIGTLKTEMSYPYIRMNLGGALFHLGDASGAKILFLKSMEEYLVTDNLEGIVWTLERVGVVDAALKRYEHAARLMGAASFLRQQLGIPLTRRDQEDWDRALATVRNALGNYFGGLWRQGSEMTWQQAVALIS